MTYRYRWPPLRPPPRPRPPPLITCSGLDEADAVADAVASSEYEIQNLFSKQYFENTEIEIAPSADGVSVHIKNLDEDFEIILKKIGIQKILHDPNKKLNVRNHKKFNEYYEDQETLDKVNMFLKEDFDNLDYERIENINDFQEKYKQQ